MGFCLICVTVSFYLYGSIGGLLLRTVLVLTLHMEVGTLGSVWKIWHCIASVKHIRIHIMGHQSMEWSIYGSYDLRKDTYAKHYISVVLWRRDLKNLQMQIRCLDDRKTFL